MAKDELFVIDRMYELVKWFLGRLEKFPRSHRYGLGQRIEARLYGVFEGLVQAKYAAGPEKIRTLETANLDLEVLRMLTRLGHELQMLPHKSHGYAAAEINEIGKMVGSWLKQQRSQHRSSIN